MTNNLQILNYNKQPIRQTVSKDGEILFCARDVAAALGYKDARDLSRNLDEAPQNMRPLETEGGVQNAVFYTEAELYEALIKSRNERCKPFRYWVTHEVLPSIRKTGFYSLETAPAQIPYRMKLITPSEAADLLKEKDEKIKALQPFKHEIERREDVAADYRGSHRKSKIYMINIRTGKPTTLWNLPYDVMSYLKGMSKVQRGLLFDKWKNQHNFNEFIRFRMKKEGFIVK